MAKNYRPRHCRKCGKTCGECHQKWLDARIAAYTQAKAELGELSLENHQAIIKRVHELEKE